jgi:hypothetical protein
MRPLEKAVASRLMPTWYTGFEVIESLEGCNLAELGDVAWREPEKRLPSDKTKIRCSLAVFSMQVTEFMYFSAQNLSSNSEREKI